MREAIHSAVFAVVWCPSVCLSRWCIVSKWLNLLSEFFIVRWPHHFNFLTLTGDLTKIPMGSPPTGVQNRGGVPKICDFQPISHCVSETMQERAIVIVER